MSVYGDALLASFEWLNKTEVAEQIAKMREGRLEARDKLLNSISRGIVKMAISFSKGSRGALAVDDMIQEGIIGAYTAIDRFDPTSKASLYGYALSLPSRNSPAGYVFEAMKQASRRSNVVPTSIAEMKLGKFAFTCGYDSPARDDSKLTVQDITPDISTIGVADHKLLAIKLNNLIAKAKLDRQSKDFEILMKMTESDEVTLQEVADLYGNCREGIRKNYSKTLSKLRAVAV